MALVASTAATHTTHFHIHADLRGTRRTKTRVARAQPITSFKSCEFSLFFETWISWISHVTR